MPQQLRDASAVTPQIDRAKAAEEDAYWRDNYRFRPYADENVGYDQYRPAYRYGYEARARFVGQRWAEVERDLERGWREGRGTSRLCWNDARDAVKDAWHRMDHHIADSRPPES
jgi:hypothetical protein